MVEISNNLLVLLIGIYFLVFIPVFINFFSFKKEYYKKPFLYFIHI